MTGDENTFTQLVLGGAPMGNLLTIAGNLIAAGSVTRMDELVCGILASRLGPRSVRARSLCGAGWRMVERRFDVWRHITRSLLPCVV